MPDSVVEEFKRKCREHGFEEFCKSIVNFNRLGSYDEDYLRVIMGCIDYVSSKFSNLDKPELWNQIYNCEECASVLVLETGTYTLGKLNEAIDACRDCMHEFDPEECAYDMVEKMDLASEMFIAGFKAGKAIRKKEGD